MYSFCSSTVRGRGRESEGLLFQIAEPALNSLRVVGMSWVLSASGGTERFLFIWVCCLVNVKFPANACRRCDRGRQGSVISEVLFQLRDALESCTLAKASSPASIQRWGR